MKSDYVLRGARLAVVLAGLLLLSRAELCLAQALQQLMPSAVSAPVGLGNGVILDPFTPADSLLVAAFSEAGSIWRVRSTALAGEPPFTRFEAVPLDATVSSSSIIYNPVDGYVYVSGASQKVMSRNNSISAWTVVRSSDGIHWEVSDEFHLSFKKTVYSSAADGLTADEAGNVFCAGRASDGRADHWVIRRKRAGAGAWETAYDAKAASGTTLAYGMCTVAPRQNHPFAAVYSVGILGNTWTVLRSQAAGALNTWDVVDIWPGDGSTANAYDVASDSNGNVYVVGVRGKDGANKGWVVRKSTDGGASWNTVLDKAEGLYSWAVKILIDSADNVWVAGAVHRPDNYPRWTLVRNSVGQSWQDSPDSSDSWARRILLPTDPNYKSKGRGMAIDAAGNLFLTGHVIDSSITTYVGFLRLSP